MSGDDDDDEEGNNSEDEFQKIKQKLTKFKNGELDSAESDDDDEDSDYEFTCGDMSLYDSTLDSIDELLFLKDTLDAIYTHKP